MNNTHMTQREFEASLKVGDRVCVRWRQGMGPGVIAEVHQKSFNVELSSAIGKYPPGSIVRVNRVASARWSAGSCVRPEAAG